ncbi:hypothetical protein J2W34_004339 [Variovorax boronicumulans]|nr:hypothetical protein [Variovorax boronicumulans]
MALHARSSAENANDIGHDPTLAVIVQFAFV